MLALTQIQSSPKLSQLMLEIFLQEYHKIRSSMKQDPNRIRKERFVIEIKFLAV